MVDGMIGVDAIWLAANPPANAASSPFVAIASNDKDMVPFCLAANRIRRGAIRLLRTTSEPQTNDPALRSAGTSIDAF
jgi:hypothetical protein